MPGGEIAVRLDALRPLPQQDQQEAQRRKDQRAAPEEIRQGHAVDGRTDRGVPGRDQGADRSERRDAHGHHADVAEAAETITPHQVFVDPVAFRAGDEFRFVRQTFPQVALRLLPR